MASISYMKEKTKKVKALELQVAYYTTLLENYSRAKTRNAGCNISVPEVPQALENMPNKSFHVQPFRKVNQNATKSSSCYLNQKHVNMTNLSVQTKRTVLSSRNDTIYSTAPVKCPKNANIPKHSNCSLKQTVLCSNNHGFSKRVVVNSVKGDSKKANLRQNVFKSDLKCNSFTSQNLISEIAVLTSQLKQTTENLTLNKSTLKSVSEPGRCNSDNSKLIVTVSNNAVPNLSEAVKSNSSYISGNGMSQKPASSSFRAVSCSPNRIKNTCSSLYILPESKVSDIKMSASKTDFGNCVPSINLKRHNLPVSKSETVTIISGTTKKKSAVQKHTSPVTPSLKPIFVKRPLLSSKKRSCLQNKPNTSKYKIINKTPAHILKLENKSVNLLPGTYKTQAKKDKNNFNLKYKFVSTPLKSCERQKRIPCAAKSKPLTKINSHLSSRYKIINGSITPHVNMQKLPLALLRSVKRKSVQKHKTFLRSRHKIVNVKSVLSEHNTLNPTDVSAKQLRIIKSKYKVINKNGVLKNGCILKSRNNIFNGVHIGEEQANNEIRFLKFSSKNKNLSHSNVISHHNVQAVLLKRVFKSKNKIINKNVSPLNQTAKMIKTKYFILNKRRQLSWQNHRFGSASSQHKGQKLNKSFANYKMRKCSKHKIVNVCAAKYAKRNRSYMSLQRTPVNGYALNKKTPKRLLFGRKALVRTSDAFKTATPVSKTLASRVLNRSISRVLTASAKKKMTKVNIYCMFYNRFGRCNKAEKCKYIHDPSKIAVCTRFLRGTCKKDSCPFSHEICPGKMAVCSYFLIGECKDQSCPYRHEKLPPGAELCKPFVQGFCSNGKQCKRAHVLVCPYFIQGACKNGDCVFPHPPQKMKKASESKTTVNDDADSEEVARYFEVLESSVYLKENSAYPPRSKEFPEQPSYIPLSMTPVSSGLSRLPEQPIIQLQENDDEL